MYVGGGNQASMEFAEDKNPSSLDWSIQSALSSLFPPFEATAPTVLSQLFRTIEERYHGDALQCLLNFLIPAKHILESVQQAACAAYSDVLFQCEGWPLCLRDRVVIQLAPINPLLLRPGDFYLQVEPFGEQSARIVLKSLLVQEELLCQENLVLQAGSRVLESPTIEGTPIPETSYPCIFTESWLKEINEGRHGNPLHLCVLSSDHGVVKVPWTKVSNPEFLDRPKSNIWPESKPCSAATIRVADIKPEISEKEPQPGVLVDIIPQEIETGVLKVKDDMAFSVQVVEGGSRLVKIDQGHPISSFSGKPIGWVSPNTWDSRQNRELEGEYVDLLEFNKEKANFLIQKIAVPPKPWGFQVVRTAQAALKSNMSEEFLNQTKQPSDLIQNNPESKCRYRQSYVAALRNPVNFERADIMVSLNESSSDVVEVEHTSEGYGVGLRLQPSSCIFGQTPNQAERNLMQSFENSAKQKQSSTQANQSVPHDCSWRENAECPDQYLNHQITNIVQVRQPHKSFPAEHQDLPQTVLGNKELLNKRPHCLNDPTKQDSFHMRINAQKHAKNQHLPKMGIRALPDHSGLRQDANLCLQGFSHLQNSQNLPTSSKQTPPLQFTQNIFQIGNIPLDCNVYSDNRHYGIGPGSSIQVIKGKSRSKIRSSSLVSETFQENKLINRSRSDVYPEIIPMLPTIQGMKYTVDPLSPKLNRQQGANKGGRDRAGRAVVEVYGGRKGWASLHISPLEVCKLLLYLHSIPRPEVRELGLTVVIDSRKCLLPSAFYKSLLMVQEQALHAVHTIMMLVNKEANPRLEKQPGLQIDVVTSLKALHKTVDGQQLTSEFAGTFTYSHEDWIHFHQKLSLFQLDLQAASSLLQSAIRRLDVKNTDSAKDVEFCIQEQRSSMKRVLEDTRLVGLQQVGGSILARLRKEVSRFAHSEDFRDCLELVTCLYNQVEEGVHTLVMKSNQLLQHLEHVLLFRKTQESLNQIQKWCESQEQSWGKDEDGNKEKSLQKIDRELQDIQSVLKQAKEKKEKGMQQIKEVQNKSRGADDPESAEFHSKSSMFKTILTGFLLKAEERKSELQTTADLYRFCQEASSLVQECMEYLDKIKTSGCLSSSHLITLKDFQERFQHFTPQHFQNRRAALLQKLPDGVWIWTALQHQCRDIRLRLSEMLKALEVTAQKKTYELSEDQSKCLSGSDLQIILDEGHTDSQNRCGGYRNCDNETVTYKGAIYNPNMKEHDELDRQHILEFEVHKRSDFKQSTPRKCCRGHSHSDTDLRQSGKVNKLDYTSCHRPLMVRSHSEESCSRSFGYNDYLCTTNAEHECKVIESCPDRILVEESDRGSWEGAGSELSHHDSFSSNASGLSQSDMNEMKSADNMSLIPRMEHADQGESVCRPDVTLENSTEQ
ncbi:hypothetical protein DNTS_007619 [Danionella cerebrum]|uniref:Uncharacterized protein n=1 Tax=Danionella cerebrum TaxID=2873325 RepID=A0A553MZL1_9TELE|nr:hypothetical protein DNTS_007619 [Danionella translucida]